MQIRYILIFIYYKSNKLRGYEGTGEAVDTFKHVQQGVIRTDRRYIVHICGSCNTVRLQTHAIHARLRVLAGIFLNNLYRLRLSQN